MDAAVPEDTALHTPPEGPQSGWDAVNDDCLAGVFLLFQKMGGQGVDELLPGAAAPPPGLF